MDPPVALRLECTNLEGRGKMLKILSVDDEKPVRELVAQFLGMSGFECFIASNAEEAKSILRNQKDIGLIVSDIKMPGESGLDLIRYVRKEYPDVAAVMITGVNDLLVAEEALSIGVYDYIVKPFGRNELLISVFNALRRRELEIENRRHTEELEEQVRERTAQLSMAMEGTIQALARVVEWRDPYTAGHQQRVAELASAIGSEMGLPKDLVDGIRMAGFVHDIGKIAVPSDILNKPGRLSEGELSLIKEHPKVGYDILKDIDFPWPIAQSVLFHHERMDGSGYPQGISGDEILLEARILAVADVVEAMSSHRPYRPALGIDAALEKIQEDKGISYDPQVVDACIKVFKEKGFKLN